MRLSNLRASLLKSVDCILGIREGLGAELAEVYIITRTWAGERPGDGEFIDVSKDLRPWPHIVDLGHNINVAEAGSIKQGDLILKQISRNLFTELDLLTCTDIDNVEKFIKVGNHYYRTIHVKEKLLTWDVHIRKVSEDEQENRSIL